MKRWIALAALVSLTGPACAAHWTVDAAKSKLGFSVMWGGEPLNGVFEHWKANIDFDTLDLDHSHAVVIIETGSEVTDYSEGDDGLKGALGFAVDRFPAARFETTGFRYLPGGMYAADGKLTIRGVSRPATLPFKLDIQGNRARVTGKLTVIRTDFGVGQGEWASERPVAHEVTVTVDLTATKG